MTTPMKPLSKTLRVNDLALHYLEWGAADAPPIVCVHGYTGSADAFNALARHLKDRFHLLAPTCAGTGRAPGHRPGPIATKIRRAIWRNSPNGSSSTNSCLSAPRWAASSR